MGDRHRYAVQQAESNKALLLVPEAVVFERERRTTEHLMRIDEVDAVVLEVLQPFTLVPLELHLRSVYTLKAVRNAVSLPDNAAVERRRCSVQRRRMTVHSNCLSGDMLQPNLRLHELCYLIWRCTLQRGVR